MQSRATASLVPGIGLGALLLCAPLPSAAQTASADTILVTARVLTGDAGGGPSSRFGPLPSTGDYVVWLRDEMDRRLASIGGYAVLDTFHPGLVYDGPEPVREVYANVVGVLPGTLGSEGPGCFMVGAHLDATAQRDDPEDGSFDPFTHPAPGADDNASGVSAVLEVARVMAVRGMRPEADLLFVLFDGEEQQLIEPNRFLMGSGHLADSLASVEKTLYGFVNMDMVAYHPEGRDSLVIVTNTRSRWLADRLLAARAHPLDGETLVESLALERLVKGLTYSDHGPFWAEGYDAVLLIEDPEIEAFAPHYHKATDTVANTYTNGGSQVKATADLVLRLVDTWTWDAIDVTPALAMTTEDILVQRGASADLAKVRVGETVFVNVGFTNVGGTFDGTASVEMRIETVDGDPLETLGRQDVTGLLPAGGRDRVSFTWTVSEAVRGAVDLVATLSGSGSPGVARRSVAVESTTGEILRAFVYPNPTRDPESAVLHYELAKGGPVRLGVIDTRGVLVAELDLSFDAVFPRPGVGVGEAEIALGEILAGANLAPGLYIARVELFGSEGGAAASTAFTKFAVLR